LENTIERAVLVGSLAPLPGQTGSSGPDGHSVANRLTIRPGLSVRAVEEALIRQTLNEVNDHRQRAAEMLGISVRTLRNKLKEYEKQTAQSEKDVSP
jgi:two-component system response regulator FlrC